MSGVRLYGFDSESRTAVWEADARTGRYTFLSRVDELLGEPAARWLGEVRFGTGHLVHPDDLERVRRHTEAAVAAGRDHELTYRLVVPGARSRWLHEVVHVLAGPDGAPAGLRGTLVDVTDRRRRERGDRLLAEAGRLLAEPGDVPARLSRVAALGLGVLGAQATVRLRAEDGRYRIVAGAPAEDVERAAEHGALSYPPERAAALRAGRGFVLSPVTLDGCCIMIVALRAEGQLVGTLATVSAPGQDHYDDIDLGLAGDLGARIAALVAAERSAARQRRLERIIAALAAASTLTEAAEALCSGLTEVLGATLTSVRRLEPDGRLHLVSTSGYPAGERARFAPIALAEAYPPAEAARERHPVWIENIARTWSRNPQLAPWMPAGSHAALAVPLLAGDRVLGVLSATFGEPREFDAGEREFITVLAGQAALAFDRAAAADAAAAAARRLQAMIGGVSAVVWERELADRRPTYVSGARTSRPPTGCSPPTAGCCGSGTWCTSCPAGRPGCRAC
jgi:GAF domain-containing protein